MVPVICRRKPEHCPAIRDNQNQRRAAIPAAVIPIQHPTDAAEERAFAAATASGLGCCGHDAIGHAAQGQRLQPDMARPAQRGEEQTFATKERGLDLADVLDVVMHAGLEADDAARIDAQHLARSKLPLDDRAARVDEGPAISLEALHDEALPAEEARANLLVEGDAEAHTLGRAQEGILLHDEFAADAREMDGNDLARIRRPEGHAFLTRPLVLEDGHEQGLSGDKPLPRAHQRAKKPIVLL
jgi:hypothetical protein